MIWLWIVIGIWILAIVGLAILYFEDLNADRKEGIWKR